MPARADWAPRRERARDHHGCGRPGRVDRRQRHRTPAHAEPAGRHPVAGQLDRGDRCTDRSRCGSVGAGPVPGDRIVVGAGVVRHPCLSAREPPPRVRVLSVGDRRRRRSHGDDHRFQLRGLRDTRWGGPPCVGRTRRVGARDRRRQGPGSDPLARARRPPLRFDLHDPGLPVRCRGRRRRCDPGGRYRTGDGHRCSATRFDRYPVTRRLGGRVRRRRRQLPVGVHRHRGDLRSARNRRSSGRALCVGRARARRRIPASSRRAPRPHRRTALRPTARPPRCCDHGCRSTRRRPAAGTAGDPGGIVASLCQHLDRWHRTRGVRHCGHGDSTVAAVARRGDRGRGRGRASPW